MLYIGCDAWEAVTHPRTENGACRSDAGVCTAAYRAQHLKGSTGTVTERSVPFLAGDQNKQGDCSLKNNRPVLNSVSRH